MGDGRFEKLTEGQRACLHLVLAHCETKEIARKLGISPDAVKKRLEVARRLLGAQRSIDAARMLEAYEAGLYPQRVYPPESIAELREAGLSDPTERVGELAKPHAVEEVVVAYSAPSKRMGNMQFPWPFPTARRPINDLNVFEIVAAAALAAPLAGIVAIGVLTIVDELIAVSMAVQDHIGRLFNTLF